MNWEEQEQMFEEVVAEELRILKQKGREYAGDHNALGNFIDGAEEIGLNPLQLWAVFARKHWKSIMQFIKDGHEHSEEPIEGRINDLRNYLFLLLGLIQELIREQKAEDKSSFEITFRCKAKLYDDDCDREATKSFRATTEKEAYQAMMKDLRNRDPPWVGPGDRVVCPAHADLVKDLVCEDCEEGLDKNGNCRCLRQIYGVEA
jgi:hypothetical protein